MYGRIDWVIERLKEMKTSHPDCGDFTIFHASRNSFGLKSSFTLVRHQFFRKNNNWVSKEYDLDGKQSYAIVLDGSGQDVVFTAVTPLTIKIGSVSRVYFQGFCKALTHTCPDPYSGGAPQLLGLGSTGVGRHYGVRTTAGMFFQGHAASFNSVPHRTQWRDSAFQSVGPNGPQMKNRRRKLIKGKNVRPSRSDFISRM